MSKDDQLNKIKEILQSHKLEKVYLRELARTLGVDPGNLSRQLQLFVDQGHINKFKEGNLTYFCLPTKHSTPPRSEGAEDEILHKAEQYLHEHEQEMVKLCQTLIRIPSVSGENPEDKIAQFLYHKARDFHLYPRMIAKEKDRPNVVVEVETKHSFQLPTFLFLGHMDTIGPGEVENWHYYPFSGHVAGNRVYGRGAVDMKAGIVCELFLLRLLKDLQIETPVQPRLLLVSNEEGGSTATKIFNVGMEHLIEEGFVEGVGAIYGYGGTYNVGIGHRGVLRVKITTKGKSVHSGSVKWQSKERGANAVTGMAEILLALENVKLPETKHPSFPYHGNVITPGTMILHGGTAVSTVPDLCESVVELRYLPGLQVKEVYHQIQTIAEQIANSRGIRVELETFVDIPAVSLSPSERIIEEMKAACQKIYKQTVSVRGTGPANESFMLIQKGIPTVVFGPLGGKAHSDNEFIDISSLKKTILVYLTMLLNYS